MARAMSNYAFIALCTCERAHLVRMELDMAFGTCKCTTVYELGSQSIVGAVITGLAEGTDAITVGRWYAAKALVFLHFNPDIQRLEVVSNIETPELLSLSLHVHKKKLYGLGYDSRRIWVYDQKTKVWSSKQLEFQVSTVLEVRLTI